MRSLCSSSSSSSPRFIGKHKITSTLPVAYYSLATASLVLRPVALSRANPEGYQDSVGAGVSVAAGVFAVGERKGAKVPGCSRKQDERMVQKRGHSSGLIRPSMPHAQHASTAIAHGGGLQSLEDWKPPNQAHRHCKPGKVVVPVVQAEESEQGMEGLEGME